MLLSISTTHIPATDLGYLLHKNPNRLHRQSLSQGNAYCFYPEATESKCTACLLLEVDPVGLVRGRTGQESSFALEQYVNDRPYVASSLMSVAIAELFGSALNGRSKERPQLAETQIPLQVEIATLPCAEGEQYIRALFEPLGYTVDIQPIQLDSKFPEWGNSDYYSVSLSGTKKLSQVLRHLYVLIPVLDDFKHYWVDEAEIQKLLRMGEGWLSQHPMVDQITHRSLRRFRSLSRQALDALMFSEPAEKRESKPGNNPEEIFEKRTSLAEQRMKAVEAELLNLEVKSVLDLGCGEGKFLKQILPNQAFKKILGLEVSIKEIEKAKEKLDYDILPEAVRSRFNLIHGSLTYLDERTKGFDASVVVEVIEHLDVNRLSTFEKNVFGYINSRVVIVTTPNIEYNAKFAKLSGFRHPDHRFEWTRSEFKSWCDKVSQQFGYEYRIAPIGENDPAFGSPTQMGVFLKCK